MSLWSTVKGLFGDRATYAVVWREHASAGAVMRGEPIDGKSDMDAISLVRARFMHMGSDWSFWVLFRPNDSMVTAEQGPKISKWPGDFAHVAAESHVQHTLESLRRHGKPVSRSLHKVRLKKREQPAEADEE
jgi:hypothetical protein